MFKGRTRSSEQEPIKSGNENDIKNKTDRDINEESDNNKDKMAPATAPSVEEQQQQQQQQQQKTQQPKPSQPSSEPQQKQQQQEQQQEQQQQQQPTLSQQQNNSQKHQPRVIIKAADMPPDMQRKAINLALTAMDKFELERDMAQFLKREFDERFQPSWHCIVGKHFGSFVTHDGSGFLYFYIDKTAILLFRSGI